MSMHKSLKVKNKHTRARNVLSREERVERLRSEERWSAGSSVFGLPKLRVEVVVPRKRAKEEKAAAEAEQPTAAPSTETPEESGRGR